MKHLPSELEIEEIEEMIEIVDKNKDGKISYSEFRVSEINELSLNREVGNKVLIQVMLGAIPLLIPESSTSSIVDKERQKNQAKNGICKQTY